MRSLSERCSALILRSGAGVDRRGAWTLTAGQTVDLGEQRVTSSVMLISFAPLLPFAGHEGSSVGAVDLQRVTSLEAVGQMGAAPSAALSFAAPVRAPTVTHHRYVYPGSGRVSGSQKLSLPADQCTKIRRRTGFKVMRPPVIVESLPSSMLPVIVSIAASTC